MFLVLDGGYWPPFHCEMRFFPEANIGIYICANGPGVVMHYPQLHVTSFAIFDLVLGNTSTNANTVLENKRSLNKKPFVEFEWGKPKTTKTYTVPKSHQVRQEVRNEELLGIYGRAVDGNKNLIRESYHYLNNFFEYRRCYCFI